jgi:hypothetical protein
MSSPLNEGGTDHETRHTDAGGFLMKVSLVLAALVLVAACGSEARNEGNISPDLKEPVAEPQATTGETTAAPAPAPQPAGSPAASPAADRRAAARGPVTLAATAEGVNPDAAILQDFNRRVAAYMKIHKDAAKGDARLKQADDPAKITASKAALAAKIQAARPAAAQGDIFTVEIRHKFRRLLAPELQGEDGRDIKAVLKDDAPPADAIKWKVNAKYPESQPLPSVPTSVLTNLPTLPAPLEYRIVETHLLLLDMDADLIVDYMWNAIPK